MKPLSGRRALVTGASGGIGRALSIELAKAGVDCVLFSRREQELAESADIVRGIGVRCRAFAGDVTDPVLREAAVDVCERELGGIDLLVNNAGVSAHGRFHESGPERLRKILEVNVVAAAEMIRLATPLLAEDGGGCVVNIGSILGWRGVPHNAEYCASKFALRGLSEAIRPELTRKGVCVLHVSPGTVETGFFDHLIEKRGELPWGKKRGVSPEFVAKRVVLAIKRGRNEVTIGWRASWFVRLARHAPWLLDRVMRRYG